MRKIIGFMVLGIIIGAVGIFSVFMFTGLGTAISMPLQTVENNKEQDSLTSYDKANLLSGHLCCINGNRSCCISFLDSISRTDILTNDTSGLLPKIQAELLGECCLDGILGCCNALQGVVSGL